MKEEERRKGSRRKRQLSGDQRIGPWSASREGRGSQGESPEGQCRSSLGHLKKRIKKGGGGREEEGEGSTEPHGEDELITIELTCLLNVTERPDLLEVSSRGARLHQRVLQLCAT